MLCRPETTATPVMSDRMCRALRVGKFATRAEKIFQRLCCRWLGWKIAAPSRAGAGNYAAGGAVPSRMLAARAGFPGFWLVTRRRKLSV
eukprot:2419843-Pleurochrysis_carterae.AAC.8